MSPVVWGEENASSTGWVGTGSSRPGFRNRRRFLVRGEGQAASATQRPGRSS